MQRNRAEGGLTLALIQDTGSVANYPSSPTQRLIPSTSRVDSSPDGRLLLKLTPKPRIHRQASSERPAPTAFERHAAHAVFEKYHIQSPGLAFTKKVELWNKLTREQEARDVEELSVETLSLFNKIEELYKIDEARYLGLTQAQRKYDFFPRFQKNCWILEGTLFSASEELISHLAELDQVGFSHFLNDDVQAMKELLYGCRLSYLDANHACADASNGPCRECQKPW